MNGKIFGVSFALIIAFVIGYLVCKMNVLGKAQELVGA